MHHQISAMTFFKGEPRFRRILYFIILVLVIPAFVINLGMIAFLDDEGIRALIALEMKLSGNYITPTMLGQFYYNKPPLYNWILLCFFNLTGVINEWTTRLPTVFFLLCYGATAYYFFKKNFDTKFGFLMAFITMTVGRIFIYDSMFGLIDICYSWVIFTMFMVIYDRWKAGNYSQIFAFAYFLAAVAYMLKGLPTFIFLGATLLALFVWKKEFKKLFSVAHLIGILIFAAIVGGYYLLYLQHNSLDDLFPQMLGQSTRRTVVRYGWEKTILNLFTFPFEQLYHFLPWTFMIIYLFQKDILKKLFVNDFLNFCMLTFIVNIPLYWTSPEVFPRYLLMFQPIFFAPLLYLHFQNNGWQKQVLKTIALFIGGAVAVASLALAFIPQTKVADFLFLKMAFLFFSSSAIVWFFYKKKQERFLLFIALLFVFRIGFNWFVLPDRLKNDRGSRMRISATKLGEMTKDQQLFVGRNTEMEWAPGFYITNARQKIMPRKKDTEPYIKDAWYVIDPYKKPDLKMKQEFELTCRHRQPKLRAVGTVSEDQTEGISLKEKYPKPKSE